MKALYKAFCHKADWLMWAAYFVVLLAPTNLFMYPRAVHLFDSVMWLSLTFKLGGVDYQDGSPLYIQAKVLYIPSYTRQAAVVVPGSMVQQ